MLRRRSEDMKRGSFCSEFKIVYRPDATRAIFWFDNSVCSYHSYLRPNAQNKWTFWPLENCTKIISMLRYVFKNPKPTNSLYSTFRYSENIPKLTGPIYPDSAIPGLLIHKIFSWNMGIMEFKYKYSLFFFRHCMPCRICSFSYAYWNPSTLFFFLFWVERNTL